MNTVMGSAKTNPDVKCLIKKLKSGELEVRNVPEEFALDSNVVKAERKLGLRKSGHRGFDIIAQTFFVEEEWFHKDLSGNLIPKPHKMFFDSFEKYYDFLDGDIYEDACYYQYAFEDEFSKNLHLDIDRLTNVKSFVTETIDDYSYERSQDEIKSYERCEKVNKKCVKQWLDKFNACDTYEQFKKVCNNYKKSGIKYREIDFFLFQYAFSHCDNNKYLDIIMKYVSKDYYNGSNVAAGLCFIYDPEAVLNRYDFSQASATTNAKAKRRVRNLVRSLKNQEVKIHKIGYFDKDTHYYCEKMDIYSYFNYQGRKIRGRSCSICQAFESFDKFIEYRNGNLINCDLSGAIDLDVDFSKYMIDDTTKLPIKKDENLSYDVVKVYENEKFVVGQFWSNGDKKIVKQQIHSFSYFFDFVAFLKGDLSGADLLLCTGIKNLSNIDGINLKDVKMTSELCEQFNVQYKSYNYDKNLIGEFPVVEKNEEETALILQSSREVASENLDNTFLASVGRIGYISDLHLMHRIKNARCRSKEDVVYTLQKIIDTILAESTSLTLIGGDISSDFSIFELFVEMLRKSEGLGSRNFVFILGNHELWSFAELSVNEIVDKYRTLLKKNGMYLLHNDLFYRNESDDMGIIPYDELIQSDNKAILEKLRCTRLVILGGLGFSGYNKEFNANDGVYRATVDKNTEIQESKKFEQIYNKLTNVLEKKNTVIFTHTPKKDWCTDASYYDNFVYVNGHTHRNMFYDDGVKRMYADNQIGYRNENPHLKSFLIDNEYEYFDDYGNGIYEITPQEYQDFSRGKNISMTFNRQVNILYMLKKNGYYCFIHKTKTGSLSMLNGGALKKLEIQDVNYYYDNMDSMIASIETPLKKYTVYQESIANEIKKIGGRGWIHGCIIDIDYYNHIYVNPIDMTIRGYWASDINNKLVYPTVPALLKCECPELYANYLKLIKGEKSNPLAVKQAKDEVALLPQVYLETDIYKASREIKKMQKLSLTVLTTWYDIASDKNKLISIK